MKLFVADIDGTLYWYNDRNNDRCSQACKDAIKKWIDYGNVFALATARTYLVRDNIINDLGIAVDYLGGNGAETVYKDGTKELHYIPISLYLEVNNWIEQQNYDATVKVCVNEQFIILHNDKYPFTYSERMRKNLAKAKMITYEECYAFKQGVNMSLLCHPSLTKEIEKTLCDRYAGKYSIIANDIDNIDFMPLNFNKGQAVCSLANRYHISKNNVIVIGDDRNDIAMFKDAGISYAMGHSNDEIKSHADHEVNLIEDAILRELVR